MTLIKTSLLNGIAVAVKMLTLLGLNKILAVYVGPTGYAVIGQFQNALQITTTFASGAINTGVTKYTAEYYDDINKQHVVWRTAGTIAIAGSLVTGILIASLYRQLGDWFLRGQENSTVFIWFGATIVFFVINALLLAILNGKKEIIRYVIANIAGSLFAIAVTGFMAVYYGLYGALVALATYQSFTFIVTLLLCRKASWFSVNYLFGRVDRRIMLNLTKYTAMALTSAVCVPVSQILIRNYLSDTLGWDYAGYWDAMLRVSAAYLMLITTTLSVYYLPRLSELQAAADIKSELVQGYKIILPVAAILGFFVYWFRDNLITILFSSNFYPMRELFAWQMIGDVLKIGGWIFAYLMWAKALTKIFITTEIVFSISYVLFAHYFIAKMGITGAVVAYALNYLIYWVVIARILYARLKS